MKKLFLVDAYALIYKSYYAFLGRPMKNSDGKDTSATFGFTKFLRDLIRKEQPQYLGVAFDCKGPTFRHEMYTEYKANRDAAPEGVHDAVPFIKEILRAMRIPILELPGYEADDVIGTLSCEASRQGFKVFMVTPDKDFGQLIDENVFIYKQAKGGEGIEIIGPDRIHEVYGIDDPCLIADILAIWGDASDNIPGVYGIGEKGATKLVSEYGTVENIIANLDKLPPKQREKIEQSRETLLLSKTLATINTAVPVEFNPDNLVMESPDIFALREIFFRLGFNMFLREMDAGSFIPHIPATGYIPQTDQEKDVITEGLEPNPRRRTRSSYRKPWLEQAQADLFTEPQTTEAFLAGNADGDSTPHTADAVQQGDLFSGQGYDTAGSVQENYRTVTDPSQLQELVARLSAEAEVSMYVHSTGTSPFNGRILGMALAAADTDPFYIPLDAAGSQDLVTVLEPVLVDGRIAKVGYDIKTDITALQFSLGIETKGTLYDIMLLDYLLDPESRHGLGHMARSLINYDPIEAESLTGKGAARLTLEQVPAERTSRYACERAGIVLRMKSVLWEKIQDRNLDDLYNTIDGPLVRVLSAMEISGVRIDPVAIEENRRELSTRLDQLEMQVRGITGEQDLNVNSAKQLGEVLFGKMKIDPKPKLTKTKQYRTDEEYLMSLCDRSPVIELVLEYRGIRKLLSTYIDSLPQLINPVTGRIHTTFNQAVTATGRISSTDPNLQNIPIRDQQGRQIRKAFIPSDQDHLILSVDYSQVELRIMAHLSGDRSLLEAFRNHEDIHTSTAAKVFGIPLSEVTANERRKAKTANFGIIYGISAYGLSQRLTIPRSEAKEIIEGYFRSYPDVKNYMDSIVEQARTDGYVTTLFGRKRFLPDIRSANPTTRGWAERNAINAPIQGSAADIIKIAMIRIHGQFAQEKLRSRLIMQVHDELVVDLYVPEKDRVIEIVTGAMTGAAELSTELPVEYGVGKNWLEAH